MMLVLHPLLHDARCAVRYNEWSLRGRTSSAGMGCCVVSGFRRACWCVVLLLGVLRAGDAAPTAVSVCRSVVMVVPVLLGSLTAVLHCTALHCTAHITLTIGRTGHSCSRYDDCSTCCSVVVAGNTLAIVSKLPPSNIPLLRS